MIWKAKFGLALGGGGARGSAHIGLLRYLEEINFPIEAISGTSAGSVIAALYSFDVPLEDMEAELRNLKPVKLQALKLNELGLFENKNLEALIDKLLPAKAKIEDASIPLAIQATDLKTGEMHIFTQGDLKTAILASCCVPGFYVPIPFGNKLLVDGGLTENVPLSGLRVLKAYYKIAINLNGHESFDIPHNPLGVLTNAFDIAINAQTKTQLKAADLVVSMDLARYSRTSNEDFHQLKDDGYRLAKKHLGHATNMKIYFILKRIVQFIKSTLPVKIPDLLRTPKKIYKKQLSKLIDET